ncbi:MAG: DUF1761 domain-containing protein [Chitinophagaceae bacterium]|nr:DUF1761 domain-containing protein [Chitinophagaceae bacterium]
MNYISFFISVFVPLVMGYIYYHPALLGNVWMKANGFTKESLGNGPKPVLYLLALLVSCLFTSFLWAWTTGVGGQEQLQVVDPIDGHSYVTFKHGVAHGIIFSITVLLPIFITMKIFEMRKWAWVFVNWGYWSITVMLMCGILSAWR